VAAYRRVYDSRHVQADCQEPGSAPEPYVWQSSMGYTFTCLFGRVSGESRQTAAWPSLPSVGCDLAGGCAREKEFDGDTVSTAQFHHGPTTGWTVKSAGRGRQAGPVSWVTWSAAAADPAHFVGDRPGSGHDRLE